MQDPVDSIKELMTLDELCKRVGMSVRNVRFYTTRGLVPPPIRRGRSGYYSDDHVSRLELVVELQAHGFTLAAIEKYVGRIPTDAPASTIALHRTLLAPWMAEHPEAMTAAELAERAGRALDAEEREVLEVLGILTPADSGTYSVAVGHLEAGLKLIGIGYPKTAAAAARKVFEDHAREIATSLDDIFHKEVWPAYRAGATSDELMTEAIEVLKPLSSALLVLAFEQAMNETKRAKIARRAQ